MHRKELHTLGSVKLGWGTGPWQEEPDKVQWTDDHTGFACLAVRQEDTGHWCGYVGLPPGHPMHGMSYNEVDAQVHGGLTYANACQGHICHVPEPGTSDHVWWLGFDCDHSGDLSPGTPARYRNNMVSFGLPCTYKALPYVEAECAKLAAQLAVAR